jgi:prophage regulatory protein
MNSRSGHFLEIPIDTNATRRHLRRKVLEGSATDEGKPSPFSFSFTETSMESAFLLDAEVEALTTLSDLTRRRQEAAGKFPRRIELAARKIGWRRADVEAWLADPRGWAARSALAAAEQQGGAS